MKYRTKLVSAGALLLGLAGATPALATMVAGPGGAPAPAPHGTRAAPAAATRNTPTLDLVTAVVQAVDLKKGTVTLGGKAVGLHPTQLRVIGTGGRAEAGASALRPGMRIRFALEPSTTAVRRLVLVYIERQP